MKEFDLIDKYFKPLTKNCQASQNLADDAAVISLDANEELIISKDLMSQDVHFSTTDGGFKIASKLLRSNISDLASSGATPLYYMLGFCKNSVTNSKFLSDFTRGLKKTQEEFSLCLIGGDTVKSSNLTFSLTIFGKVKKGKNLKRCNAQDGDLIFVSSTIGDAYIYRLLSGIEQNINQKELTKISKKFQNFLEKRHFFPQPRVQLGEKLVAQNLSSCATDISDGLIADLNQICRSSQISAIIELSKVPLSAASKNFLQKNPQISIEDLISGGEDYELIFAVKPKDQQKILRLSQDLKLDLTCIGTFKKTDSKNYKTILIDAENRKIKIKKTGYEH